MSLTTHNTEKHAGATFATYLHQVARVLFTPAQDLRVHIIPYRSLQEAAHNTPTHKVT
jgi:hypothetical protein